MAAADLKLSLVCSVNFWSHDAGRTFFEATSLDKYKITDENLLTCPDEDPCDGNIACPVIKDGIGVGHDGLEKPLSGRRRFCDPNDLNISVATSIPFEGTLGPEMDPVTYVCKMRGRPLDEAFVLIDNKDLDGFYDEAILFPFAVQPGEHKWTKLLLTFLAILEKTKDTDVVTVVDLHVSLKYEDKKYPDRPTHFEYNIALYTNEFVSKSENKKIVKRISSAIDCKIKEKDSFLWDLVPVWGNVRTIRGGLSEIEKGNKISGGVQVAVGGIFLALDAITLGTAASFAANMIAKKSGQTVISEGTKTAGVAVSKRAAKRAAARATKMAATEATEAAAKKAAAKAAFKKLATDAGKRIVTGVANEIASAYVKNKFQKRKSRSNAENGFGNNNANGTQNTGVPSSDEEATSDSNEEESCENMENAEVPSNDHDASNSNHEDARDESRPTASSSAEEAGFEVSLKSCSQKKQSEAERVRENEENPPYDAVGAGERAEEAAGPAVRAIPHQRYHLCIVIKNAPWNDSEVLGLQVVKFFKSLQLDVAAMIKQCERMSNKSVIVQCKTVAQKILILRDATQRLASLKSAIFLVEYDCNEIVIRHATWNNFVPIKDQVEIFFGNLNINVEGMIRSAIVRDTFDKREKLAIVQFNSAYDKREVLKEGKNRLTLLRSPIVLHPGRKFNVNKTRNTNNNNADASHDDVIAIRGAHWNFRSDINAQVKLFLGNLVERDLRESITESRLMQKTPKTLVVVTFNNSDDKKFVLEMGKRKLKMIKSPIFLVDY